MLYRTSCHKFKWKRMEMPWSRIFIKSLFRRFIDCSSNFHDSWFRVILRHRAMVFGRRGVMSWARWCWTLASRKLTRISMVQKFMFFVLVLSVLLLIYMALSVSIGDYYSYISKRHGPPPVVDYVCNRNHVEFESSSLDEVRGFRSQPLKSLV